VVGVDMFLVNLVFFCVWVRQERGAGAPMLTRAGED
jgi:hypothetical protein